MSRIATIELLPEERTPCEVWTRVMGYHRPVAAFNAGKRAEHADRLYFCERPAGARRPSHGGAGRRAVA
jgi:hypothetical protein